MNISTNIRTIDEFGSPRELEGDEIQKAIALSFSIAFDRGNKSRILYRGVSKEYLVDRLIREYEESTDHVIASRLFFFGEKSAHYRNELKIKQMRKYLKDIEDISPATSNKIFDLINGLRKTRKDEITSFQKANPEFFCFFLNKQNKPIFSKMISELGQEARDYFLGFLHTAGKIGIGERSTSISTSYSLEQAISFAGRPKQDRFVIISVKRLIKRDLNTKSILADIEKYGVPTLPHGSAIFEKQAEETLRSGIFPHDIIGVQCLHSNELIINPFIFSDRNRKVNIMLNPLHIDQVDFPGKLAQHTNYSSYFYTFDRSYLCEDTADFGL